MRVFVIAIVLLTPFLRYPAELHAQSSGPAVAPSRIFFVADRSESMLGISPPETTLVVLNHVLDLAALAQQPIEVCVITYSGEGVHVFGQDGKPTAAYETLRAELLQKWPKPVGGTPMDEAFQTLLQLLKESGQGAETTIISIHDGVPSSGLLRPEVFPEVREAIDRKLAAAIEKSKLFPPNVQQEFVRRIEEPLYNPETREFEELYAVQLPLEVKRVVGLASNLKAFKPRFITIDFKGVPTLAEMHAAAGGSPDDLLQISPSEVIQHLHKRNVTSLARIVQLPDVQIQATPEALEATTDLTIDPIADEVLVTIELTPAQPEFLERSELTISSAGFETSISDDTEGAEFHVCRDAQNNVATISLRLQNPRSESIRIDWKSRQGDSTVPAMQIRSWMRLKESIAAELYPEHIDPSGTIPHQVTANRPLKLYCRLLDTSTSDLLKLKSGEVVLRQHTADNTSIRSALHQHETAELISDEMTLPPGEYHADLYLHRPSGIVLKLTLPNQIVSVIRKERLAIEIPLALENEQLVSGERSHIDFGLLGDTVNTVVREFSIRSLEVDYPLQVRLETQIADPDGNVPQTAWFRFNPASITLQPGKAQKIKVTLTLPKDIESQIVDGVFDGQIVAENAETRQPLTLERFEPISGVPADAPVQRLTFELKRPRFFIQVPWALRNWTKKDSENGTLVRVRQDVDRPFQRTVQVRVRNPSRIARDVTVLPSGLLKDTEGRSISEMRLVTAPDSESTRSVAAGQTETWEFVFEADQQTTIAKAVTGIDVRHHTHRAPVPGGEKGGI